MFLRRQYITILVHSTNYVQDGVTFTFMCQIQQERLFCSFSAMKLLPMWHSPSFYSSLECHAVWDATIDATVDAARNKRSTMQLI